MAPSKHEDKNTKRIKEMIRGNFRSRWSVIESIPDELLFEILIRLPAHDIYYASRLVCSKWYHMVCAKDFVQKHLEHASYGLLYRDESLNVAFVSAREDGGGIHKYKLYYYDDVTILSGCNGLMLKYIDSDFEGRVIYDVVNVSTNKALRLPSLPYPDTFPYPPFCGKSCGIGYDASSMTYKVVVMGYRCDIFTVGVDKSWRNLRVDHLSLVARQTIVTNPIITEGYMHWNQTGLTEVVTLNLETEEIVETFPPIPRAFHCMSTGRYLTIFLQCGKLLWEVYEMKPEIGEWRKLYNISLEGQKGRIERLGFEHDDMLKPCGWLKYPEVLALIIRESYIIFYNLTTREIGTEKLTICAQFLQVTLHKDSLVSF